ncbi:anchored repeat ABC transporter, substrate-binding protein [Brachybacterium sp. Marseille-Q7125]|uniref:anchored repeat ABC transporter, substrate-binding protein n=1 Tax=Brachybacterium sp. Marseille-Q7125 TaxID=2932815 RepID=UPI001FF47EBA
MTSTPHSTTSPRRRILTVAVWLVVLCLVVLVPGRSTTASEDGKNAVRVVATTGILADLARNVAGDRAEVISLVPEGGDPHTYEPSLRDARDIVHADLALSNYLMLEEQSLIRTLDANLPADAVHVALAEEASGYGAEIIPLVEHQSLDTVWLGLRVHGADAIPEVGRSAQVEMTMTGVDGPGDVFAYVTGTFGTPQPVFSSGDGFDAGNGYAEDTIGLPLDAHTHLSWAFTKPGVYRMKLATRYLPSDGGRARTLATQTVTVAVGVDPSSALGGSTDPMVLESGHVDLTADLGGGLDGSTIALATDGSPADDTDQTGADAAAPDPRQMQLLDPQEAVISVPPKALLPIPGDPAFRFLGRPGTDIYQLPQAVLGKHVHGEIDPHLWQDVSNAQAYVEVIRDQLISIDPAGAGIYRRNASAYLEQLEEVDEYVRERIDSIPESHRELVTTHDAYGYLAHAYGLKIAGFVAPNPAGEPSLADRRRLSATLDGLKVPAVFLEPNAQRASTVLTDAARQHGIEVCPILGDAFTPEITTYIEMMRANADSLATCLNP